MKLLIYVAFAPRTRTDARVRFCGCVFVCYGDGLSYSRLDFVKERSVPYTKSRNTRSGLTHNRVQQPLGTSLTSFDNSISSPVEIVSPPRVPPVVTSSAFRPLLCFLPCGKERKSERQESDEGWSGGARLAPAPRGVRGKHQKAR